MGITTKALQLDEVGSGDISRGGIHPVLEQGDCLSHHLVLFAVQQRHQPELTLGLLRLALNPTPLQGLLAYGLRLLISPESLGLIAPNLTAELVEEQHKGEAVRCRVSPSIKLADQGPLHMSSEKIAKQPIEAVPVSKPLPGTALLKPEVQNVVSGQDEQL